MPPSEAIGPRRLNTPVKPETAQDCAPGGNQLLARLSPSAFAHLQPHLEPVQLARRQILFQAGESLTSVYFPDTAVVSLVSRLGSGEALDVGFVGSEGVAGTAVLPGITTMPCDGTVQVPGRARRLGAARLRTEVLADASLHSAIDCFAHLLLVRSMQVSLCNMFHTAEQRCIRCLSSMTWSGARPFR